MKVVTAMGSRFRAPAGDFRSVLAGDYKAYSPLPFFFFWFHWSSIDLCIYRISLKQIITFVGNHNSIFICYI